MRERGKMREAGMKRGRERERGKRKEGRINEEMEGEKQRVVLSYLIKVIQCLMEISQHASRWFISDLNTSL